MNLDAEAQRIEAFVKLYGQKEEACDPTAGIGKRGFELVCFDPETAYAQFRTRDRENASVTSDQYVEYTWTIVRGHVLKAKRDRFYVMDKVRGKIHDMRLFSASLDYEQNGYNVCLEALYPDKPRVKDGTPNVFLEVRKDDTILARCNYRNLGLLPDSIQITADTVEEARKSREHPGSTHIYDEVPNNISIRRSTNEAYHIWGPGQFPHVPFYPKWGEIADGGNIIDHRSGCLVSVRTKESKSLEVVRESSRGNHLVFTVPQLNPIRLDAAMRGHWMDFMSYPVEYDFAFNMLEK